MATVRMHARAAAAPGEATVAPSRRAGYVAMVEDVRYIKNAPFGCKQSALWLPPWSRAAYAIFAIRSERHTQKSPADRKNPVRRARRLTQGPCRLGLCHKRLTSHDTWQQKIATRIRRGRFINTVSQRGLATADDASDRSDNCSLGRSVHEYKPCCIHLRLMRDRLDGAFKHQPEPRRRRLALGKIE